MPPWQSVRGEPVRLREVAPGVLGEYSVRRGVTGSSYPCVIFAVEGAEPRVLGWNSKQRMLIQLSKKEQEKGLWCVRACVQGELERPADILPQHVAAPNWDPSLFLPSCWLSSEDKRHADSSRQSGRYPRSGGGVGSTRGIDASWAPCPLMDEAVRNVLIGGLAPCSLPGSAVPECLSPSLAGGALPGTHLVATCSKQQVPEC